MKINQIGLSHLATEKIQQTEVLMKTRSFLLAASIMLAMAFTFSCDSGGGGGGGNNGNIGDAITYTGTADGVTYTLKIEDGGSRTALTPAQGDSYTLTQSGKTSTGMVISFTGGVLTLKPSNSSTTFTTKVSGNGITAMSGTITWGDGTANEAPDTFTPSGGIDPGPGPGPSSGPTNWTAVADGAFGTSDIRAIAYGNNRFVAGGQNFQMAYSDDNGASWTKAPTGALVGMVHIQAIAYGSNKFVAVGYDGPGYSDDGASWTKAPYWRASSFIFDAVAYGNGKFVAGGSGGTDGNMGYSSDGISWTAFEESTFSTNDISAIAYDNNRFVAVGRGGKMAYSSDGISWTAVANSTFGTSDIRAIAYGNNRFVAVGWDGKMAYSANGASWTAVTNSTFDSRIEAIAYGNNRFVAGGSEGKIAYSENGASWTAAGEGVLGTYTYYGDYTEADDIYAIVYGNNRFVAVGEHGKMAYAEW